ncbi:hypothetical protein NUKP41_28710 [Klebsiella variicola]|nr:hypothetical protein NUKP41_28710 [Klebsiella variicola]
MLLIRNLVRERAARKSSPSSAGGQAGLIDERRGFPRCKGVIADCVGLVNAVTFTRSDVITCVLSFRDGQV